MDIWLSLHLSNKFDFHCTLLEFLFCISYADGTHVAEIFVLFCIASYLANKNIEESFDGQTFTYVLTKIKIFNDIFYISLFLSI